MTSISKAPKISVAAGQGDAVPEQPLGENGEPVKPKKKKLTKAEKKELKRQREIEFRKLEVRATFQRELELSRKTAKKIKTAWEDTLSEMKIVELKQELVIWEQKAQRSLDEKIEKVQFLVKFISELEDMNLLVSAKGKELLNHITDIYKVLVNSTRTLYEEEARHSIIDFQEALNEKRSYQDGWRLHCENIMHTTNLIFEKEMLTDYHIFVERRNDRVNVAIERRYKIRDGVVSKMKASRQQLVDFVHELSTASLDPHKYERIRQLMDRQRMFFIESKRLNELEDKQTHMYGDLQRDLLHSEIDFQRKANDLRLELSYFIEVRNLIERKMAFDRSMTLEKLRVLTSESYVVQKQLQKIRDYGELLLSVSANVRKFQTETEKIMINGDLSPTELEDLRRFVIVTVNPDTHVDCDKEELYNSVNLMRIFWRRQAIVETQNAMLLKEKEQLLAENKKYTNFIKSFNKATNPNELFDSLKVQCVLPTVVECPHFIRRYNKR